jgi:MIP family channel proteins
VLLTFGLGVVAQTVLSKQTAGSMLSINICWGIAVAMGCYVTGGVSGAHLNPAVTIALAVHRRFPRSKVGSYILAQFVAALVASTVVFLSYHDSLAAFDGGVRHVTGELGTAGIFATYPRSFTTLSVGFLNEAVGTALLMGVILGLTDARSVPPPRGLTPVIVGLLVVAIGASFGFNTGYAINPARDFGPRLFTAFAGWGSEVFTAANNWWWVPIVAPCVGGVVGGWVYDLCDGSICLMDRASRSRQGQPWRDRRRGPINDQRPDQRPTINDQRPDQQPTTTNRDAPAVDQAETRLRRTPGRCSL